MYGTQLYIEKTKEPLANRIKKDEREINVKKYEGIKDIPLLQENTDMPLLFTNKNDKVSGNYVEENPIFMKNEKGKKGSLFFSKIIKRKKPSNTINVIYKNKGTK